MTINEATDWLIDFLEKLSWLVFEEKIPVEVLTNDPNITAVSFVDIKDSTCLSSGARARLKGNKFFLINQKALKEAIDTSAYQNPIATLIYWGCLAMRFCFQRRNPEISLWSARDFFVDCEGTPDPFEDDAEAIALLCQGIYLFGNENDIDHLIDSFADFIVDQSKCTISKEE